MNSKTLMKFISIRVREKKGMKNKSICVCEKERAFI